MAQTPSSLAAIAVVGLLLGAGFAMAGPFGEELDEQASPDEDEAAGSDAHDEGQMTVEASESTHEGVEANTPPFYASRVVTLEGRLTLASLPVFLSNVNGEIEVTAAEGESFSLVANLTAWGSTPEQARQERENMRFEWEAGQPGDRRLSAQVEHGNEDNGSDPLFSDEGRKESRLRLRVPADVALSLRASSTNARVHVDGIGAKLVSASTSNGDVHLEGLEAARLEVDTTNGRVSADVEGTEQVDLGSTNGAIEARLVPAASGSITATTTNENVDVSVPETDERGYEVTASTTNGHATIELEDGSSESSDDGTQARFLTHGFEERSIQTSVQLSSTNGDVAIGPT